jgi:hypothetical protein
MVQMRFSQRNSRSTEAHPAFQRRRSARLRTSLCRSFRAGRILTISTQGSALLHPGLRVLLRLRRVPRCDLLTRPNCRALFNASKERARPRMSQRNSDTER